MTWIDDNKDSGPWDFEERPDKWGYINNPGWTGTPAHSDAHRPCGHWHREHVPDRWRIDAGEWVAAKSRPGTPYVYLYDIGEKSVIKLETSAEIHIRVRSHIVIKEILILDHLYDLDHTMGYGIPGAQRGGYCISKDGERLWYLFRDGSGNCQLVEVDISKDLMEVVRRTTYPTLVGSQTIQDGCTDGTYTYWGTDLKAGRIIKIRNSDHVIVDDHLFSFNLYGCATNNEGICTIDYSVKTGSLYWTYVLDQSVCTGALQHTACTHYIKSATDFSIEEDHEECGLGVTTHQWQNLIRVADDESVLQHRAYWPSYGYLTKRYLENFVSTSFEIDQDYLQNILGVYRGLLFTLMHVNSVASPAFIYCINLADMGEVLKLDVTHYLSHAYLGHVNWSWTSVSVLNEQTGILTLLRYDTVGKINRLACFRADEELELLSDVGLWYMEIGGNLQEILDEPQIWAL